MTPQQFESISNYILLICYCLSVIIFALAFIQFRLGKINKALEEITRESRNRELMDLFTVAGPNEVWEDEHMKKLGKRIKELLDDQ